MSKNSSSCSTSLLAALLLCAGVGAHAADPVVPRVWSACKVEIELFCNDISPGNGRMIACLYAYEDELSTTCDYHLLRAAGELRDLMDELNQVTVACKPDIESKCAGIQQGKGRVARCLKQHEKQISNACHAAIEATGIDLR